MRNHLAIDVLGFGMLNLFWQYQISLGAEGSKLNGVIRSLHEVIRKYLCYGGIFQ